MKFCIQCWPNTSLNVSSLYFVVKLRSGLKRGRTISSPVSLPIRSAWVSALTAALKRDLNAFGHTNIIGRSVHLRSLYVPCMSPQGSGQDSMLCHIFSSASMNEVVSWRTGRGAPVWYLEVDHESWAQTNHFVLLADSVKNDVYTLAEGRSGFWTQFCGFHKRILRILVQVGNCIYLILRQDPYVETQRKQLVSVK
jgi:hypothetical protein